MKAVQLGPFRCATLLKRSTVANRCHANRPNRYSPALATVTRFQRWTRRQRSGLRSATEVPLPRPWHKESAPCLTAKRTGKNTRYPPICEPYRREACAAAFLESGTRLHSGNGTAEAGLIHANCP